MSSNIDINEYLNRSYNPKQDYRHYNHIGYIIKSIKPEQKVESINYYLDNVGENYDPKYEKIFFRLLKLNFYTVEELVSANAFVRIFNICTPKYFADIPPSIFNNKHFIDALLKCNIEREIFDYLPKVLRDNSIIQKKFNRKERLYNYSGLDNNGYDREWLDNNGNLIFFFSLANGFVIQNKNDYLKLVKEYLDNHTSVPNFCEKYKISSVDGFNRLLDRVSKENLDKNDEINEIKSNSQDLFKKSLFSYIDQIIDGTITVDEYFKKYYKPAHNLGIIMNFASIKNCSRELAKMLLDYYFEYKEPYTNNMINFLNKPSVIGVNNPFNYFRELKYKLKSPDDNSYYRKIKDICNHINKCSLRFVRNNMYITYKINDEVAVVDDEVIDQALAFIKDNNIYMCSYNVKTIAKEIAFGRIDYKVQTSEIKEKMKNNLNDLLDQVKSIDEYIDIVKMSGKVK